MVTWVSGAKQRLSATSSKLRSPSTLPTAFLRHSFIRDPAWAVLRRIQLLDLATPDHPSAVLLAQSLLLEAPPGGSRLRASSPCLAPCPFFPSHSRVFCVLRGLPSVLLACIVGRLRLLWSCFPQQPVSFSRPSSFCSCFMSSSKCLAAACVCVGRVCSIICFLFDEGVLAPWLLCWNLSRTSASLHQAQSSVGGSWFQGRRKRSLRACATRGTRSWCWPPTFPSRACWHTGRRHTAVQVAASCHFALLLGLVERDCLD